MQKLIFQNARNRRLKKRNFARGERLWEYGVIPYEIDPKISEFTDPGLVCRTNTYGFFYGLPLIDIILFSTAQSDLISTIKAGIDQMNKYTCLRILPRSETTNLNLPHKQYLLFQPDS